MEFSEWQKAIQGEAGEENKKLKKEIEKLKAKNKELEEEVKNLNNDCKALCNRCYIQLRNVGDELSLMFFCSHCALTSKFHCQHQPSFDDIMKFANGAKKDGTHKEVMDSIREKL